MGMSSWPRVPSRCFGWNGSGSDWYPFEENYDAEPESQASIGNRSPPKFVSQLIDSEYAARLPAPLRDLLQQSGEAAIPALIAASKRDEGVTKQTTRDQQDRSCIANPTVDTRPLDSTADLEPKVKVPLWEELRCPKKPALEYEDRGVEIWHTGSSVDNLTRGPNLVEKLRARWLPKAADFPKKLSEKGSGDGAEAE